MIPDFLSHYYEAKNGPFRNLSDLSLQEAEQIQINLRQAGQTFASKRTNNYLGIRRKLEEQVRQLFIQKGGKPVRPFPHYMVLGSCAWLKNWYQDGRALQIPLSNFDPAIISFTYGDTFPAMRYEDKKPYRKQVFTLDELPTLIQTYGLPQVWNKNGDQGPDRYIEAQIWSNKPLQNFLSI